MKYSLTFLLVTCVMASGLSQRSIQLRSPDGNIVFNFALAAGVPQYRVSYKQKNIIENSTISLDFENTSLSRGVRMLRPVYREGVERYTLVVGKASAVNESFREVTVPLESTAGSVKINLLVRAFNGGIAWRYEFLKVGRMDSLVLTDEKTTFRVAETTRVHALQLPHFTSSHEGYYSDLRLKEIRRGSLMDMPSLFELPGDVYLAITEAELKDYAGMYLTVEDGHLRSTLSPLPGQTTVKVKAALPHKSPWRVLMISDRIGALIESNILTNLNAPCKIKDTNWIRPGKTTFPWWNGNVVPDTLNAPGNNFITQKYYIDFCARNGIEYHSVVEYGLHQWYVDDGVGFQPGPHSDVTKAVPGLDMKEVCDYAHSKGVGVRVWVHWAALYPKLDSAFAQFERWGLSGMMIDFMDRDDQVMVNMQNEMLEKAAAHHLHVQFHGAYKPTGMQRTWPNEFTREGTLNYEINKWDEEGLPPDHDIMIPFTRMLAGSTDYHLGGFRAAPMGKYYRQYTRPIMRGTRCHMLAMYVVLENYLGMVCDYPDAYEGQPGFDFIRQVPTTWDETRVVDARIGEYVVIARRKGKAWFVGAITNHEARSLEIPLSFLSSGNYSAVLFRDTADAENNPNDVAGERRSVLAADHVTVRLAPGGGTVLVIKPG